MQGLSRISQPPANRPDPSGRFQFSLAQLLSLIFAVCVLASLCHLALGTNLQSSAPVWMALAGWLAAVTALLATRLLRTISQFVVAALIAVMIAALALAT